MVNKVVDDTVSTVKKLPTPTQETAVGGGNWIEAGALDEQKGLVGRYRKTTAAQTITADPKVEGSAQNKSNLLPREIEHAIEVVFPAGTYTGINELLRTGRHYIHSTGSLVIRGAGMDETRVAGGIDGMFEGRMGNITIKDIHLDGISSFSGPVTLQNCKLSGLSKPAIEATGTCALAGKRARVYAENCIIGKDTDDYALWVSPMDRYHLEECTLRARSAAVKGSKKADVRMIGGTVDAEKLYSDD